MGMVRKSYWKWFTATGSYGYLGITVASLTWTHTKPTLVHTKRHTNTGVDELIFGSFLNHYLYFQELRNT